MVGMGMVVITVVGAVMLSVARRPVRAGKERRRRLSRGLVEREVLPYLFFSLLVTIFTHDELTYAGSGVSRKTVSPPQPIPGLRRWDLSFSCLRGQQNLR